MERTDTPDRSPPPPAIGEGHRPAITVVRTFVSNLASVNAALRKLGAEPRPSRDPDEVAGANLVLLPGVGSFDAGARSLADAGLDRALAHRVKEGLPTLAICLGMQLLFEASEESPGARGLGSVPGAVVRLSEGSRLGAIGEAAAGGGGADGRVGAVGQAAAAGAGAGIVPSPARLVDGAVGSEAAGGDTPLRIPHLGWNRIEAEGAGLVEGGWAYFAHSYCAAQAPPGWTPAYATHGRRFIAALERGRILACQFHPELSGAYGLDLIDRWMKGGLR